VTELDIGKGKSYRNKVAILRLEIDKTGLFRIRGPQQYDSLVVGIGQRILLPPNCRHLISNSTPTPTPTSQ
jgi:hypothetical protein